MPAESYDLSTTEAAKYLDVFPDTLLRWVKAGKVTAAKTPGGLYRFRRSDLDASLTPVEASVATPTGGDQ